MNVLTWECLAEAKEGYIIQKQRIYKKLTHLLPLFAGHSKENQIEIGIFDSQ